jgi:integrase
MSLYIRGSRYYLRKQIALKRYCKALGLRKGQESLLSERLKQVEDEIIAKAYGLIYQRQKQINFIDYSKKYLRSGEHKATWEREKQRLAIVMDCWNDPPLRDIDREHVERLEKFLFARGLRSSTVNRYFEILRHLFAQAIEDGYLQENPCHNYQPFQETGTRRLLRDNELRFIIATAKSIQVNKPRSPIQKVILDLILFALSTGLRLSEMLNLKREYILKDCANIPIMLTKSRRRTDIRSGIKVRTCILNATAQEIISRQPIGAYVFALKDRSPNAVYWTVQRIRRESGVLDFGFHQLRHRVSTIIASHASLGAARIMLGHSDLRTTLSYTHPEIEEMRKVASILDTEIKASLDQIEEKKREPGALR